MPRKLSRSVQARHDYIIRTLQESQPKPPDVSVSMKRQSKCKHQDVASPARTQDGSKQSDCAATAHAFRELKECQQWQIRWIWRNCVFLCSGTLALPYWCLLMSCSFGDTLHLASCDRFKLDRT